PRACRTRFLVHPSSVEQSQKYHCWDRGLTHSLRFHPHSIPEEPDPMNAQPIALVTGATSGIGEATAYRLQARGYVVLGAGRNPAALDRLRSGGLQARTLEVTDETAVAQLAEEIHTDYGRLDVLVNSAGFPFPSPLEQVALSDLRRL